MDGWIGGMIAALVKVIRDERGGVPDQLLSMGLSAAVLASTAAVVANAQHVQAVVHSYRVASSAVNDSVNRFARDAQSAKAVGVLPTDANGVDNSDGHEFDVLYENVDGALSLARYTYTAATGCWQRTVQTPSSAPTPDGSPVCGLTVFQATVATANELNQPTDALYVPMLSTNPAQSPQDVEIATQYAGLNAGNVVVEVRVANAVQDVPVDVIAGGVYTANLTEITGAYTPPPPTYETCQTGYSGSVASGYTPTYETLGPIQWYDSTPSCPSYTAPPGSTLPGSSGGTTGTIDSTPPPNTPSPMTSAPTPTVSVIPYTSNSSADGCLAFLSALNVSLTVQPTGNWSAPSNFDDWLGGSETAIVYDAAHSLAQYQSFNPNDPAWDWTQFSYFNGTSTVSPTAGFVAATETYFGNASLWSWTNPNAFGYEGDGCSNGEMAGQLCWMELSYFPSYNGSQPFVVLQEFGWSSGNAALCLVPNGETYNWAVDLPGGVPTAFASISQNIPVRLFDTGQ